ncbi:hypothetical protein scyTo_0023984, partial [Scyliorhinus torazame]|nr:hypothetical protein [Scyliorhinus torazame]
QWAGFTGTVVYTVGWVHRYSSVHSELGSQIQQCTQRAGFPDTAVYTVGWVHRYSSVHSGLGSQVQQCTQWAGFTDTAVYTVGWVHRFFWKAFLVSAQGLDDTLAELRSLTSGYSASMDEDLVSLSSRSGS